MEYIDLNLATDLAGGSRLMHLSGAIQIFISKIL